MPAAASYSSLSGAYRAAQAALVAAVPTAPADKAAQLALIDTLAEGRGAAAGRPGLLKAPAIDEATLAPAQAALNSAMTDFAAATGMDEAGRTAFLRLPFAAATEKLAAMASDPDGLFTWLSWSRAAADDAMAPLAEALANGKLSAQALPAFDRAVANAVWRAASRASPELATFDAAQHAATEEEFRHAGQGAAGSRARRWRMRKACERRDRAALQVVRGEIAKRRGFMPIRNSCRWGRRRSRRSSRCS